MRCRHSYLLERSANNLHMVQLMPLPSHHVCFSKIQNRLSFWYRLTWVVPDKGHKTVVVVVVVWQYHKQSAYNMSRRCPTKPAASETGRCSADSECSVLHCDGMTSVFLHSRTSSDQCQAPVLSAPRQISTQNYS